MTDNDMDLTSIWGLPWKIFVVLVQENIEAGQTYKEALRTAALQLSSGYMWNSPSEKMAAAAIPLVVLGD